MVLISLISILHKNQQLFGKMKKIWKILYKRIEATDGLNK